MLLKTQWVAHFIRLRVVISDAGHCMSMISNLDDFIVN